MKWFVRTVRTGIDKNYHNKQALILVSNKQNSGKSTYCRFLCPPALGGYIAENINPDTLILIETTVAPGTTEQIAYPIMKKTFERRDIASPPLLAHSYERVMPGREYVSSIRDFWRVCSGCDAPARERVVNFDPFRPTCSAMVCNAALASTLAVLDS